MRISLRLLATLLLFSFSYDAFAQADQFPGLMSQFKQISGNINNDLVKPAMMLAASALSLQWILSHWKDIYTGDITGLLAKMVGVVSWGGITFWLLQHQDLLSGTFSGYLRMAGIVSGVGEAGFDPGDVMAQGIMLIDQINASFTKSAGFTINPVEIGTNILLALMLMVANLLTFLCYLIIALSIFVCQAEFWLMFAVAPLAFGLIPLSAFRDQGISPVKGVISLGLRIIILGMIVRITSDLTNNLSSMLTNNPPPKDHFFTPFWWYMAGMAASAIMAFSAGKIASSIASGSASFSGSDAIKGGMQLATTAAAGAAAVTAVGAVAGNTASAAGKGLEAAGSSAGSRIGAMRDANNLGVAPGAPSSGGGSGFGESMPKDPSAKAETSNNKAGNAAGSSNSGSASTNDSASNSNQSGGNTEAGNVTGSSNSGSASTNDSASNSNQSGGNERVGDATPASQISSTSGGDASNAGISGSPDSAQQKNQSNEQPQAKKPSFGDQLEKAVEHTSQDNHAVSVSINLRGE